MPLGARTHDCPQCSAATHAFEPHRGQVDDVAEAVLALHWRSFDARGLTALSDIGVLCMWLQCVYHNRVLAAAAKAAEPRDSGPRVSFGLDEDVA